MKRQGKTMAGAGIAAIMLAVLLCMPILAQAGELEPTAPPTAVTMHSLEDIYDVLKAFKKTPAEVCEGTIFIGLREDGTIGEQTGIKDCSPPATTTTTTVSTQRFVDNNNGTVTDTRTGLIWLKNANPCGTKNWYDAGTYCANLASGQAGLTDGSTAGQWRLHTVEELEGIGTDPPTTYCLDASCNQCPVTWTMPGAPFTGVQSYYYWSGTSYAINTDYAWFVSIDNGDVYYYYSKSYYDFYVWPVRGDN